MGIEYIFPQPVNNGFPKELNMYWKCTEGGGGFIHVPFFVSNQLPLNTNVAFQFRGVQMGGAKHSGGRMTSSCSDLKHRDQGLGWRMYKERAAFPNPVPPSPPWCTAGHRYFLLPTLLPASLPIPCPGISGEN